MFSFTRVYAENFMGFKKLDVDLSAYRGITLIEGRRRGSGRSNGAGKSTLFEAIYWCLYDALLRPMRKVDKVMRRGMERGEQTVVRVTTEIDGVGEVTFERARSRSGPSFRILGLPEGKSSTIAGMQDRADGLLGQTAQEFVITSMFGGAKKFCQLPDGERAKALLVILEQDLSRKLDRRDSLIGDLDRAIVAKQDEVSRSIGNWSSLTATWRQLVKASRVEARNANEASAALAEFYQQAAVRRAAEDALRAKLQGEEDAIEAKLGVQRKALAEAEAKVTAKRAAITTLSAEIDSLKTDDHPEVCPHCNQRWPVGKLGKAHLDGLLVERRERLQKLKSELAPLDGQRFKLTQEEQDVAVEKRELQARLRALGGQGDTNEERTLLAQAIEAETRLEGAQEDLLAHEDRMDPDLALSIDVARFDEEIARLRTESADLDDAIADLHGQQATLDFWKKGFSRSGFPSFLLDSSIPEMNARVGAIAADLSEGELTVSFNPAAAKGKGDVFAVEVEYADGADDYDMTSTGEHVRVDLAVLFAIRDLVANRGRNQCRQLFMDELFNGTDPAFCDAVMATLRKHYAKHDVFVISHDDAVKNLCDNSIVVRKRGKVAEIAGTEAA